MPYKSRAQQAFMHARHPKIAARWDRETPDFSALPRKVGGYAKRGKKKAKKGGYAR